MNKEEFYEECKKLNINLTTVQKQQLEQYYQLLTIENEKYNLTSITKEEDVYLKHFYDSICIIKGIDINNKYICDIGTGAGFPGIVIKIVFPNTKIALLDATEKKCQFLELVISKLNLRDIEVINMRAEEYSKKVREKYDIVTSRAVAPLKHLLEYSIPLLKIDGAFVALKSHLDEELKNIENYYSKLKLSNEKVIEFILPKEGSKRTIYIIKKNEKTPKIYPRTYSQIKKREI